MWVNPEWRSAVVLVGLVVLVGSVQLDVSSDENVRAVSKSLAQGLIRFYSGNQPGQTPGLLPNPYFWWEAGAMFMTLIEYWSLTGDSTYNRLISDAIVFQAGSDYDYMPPNQTLTEGNDDQAFWAFAALDAAEHGFPDVSGKPSWVGLAQNVFNQQAGRWDTAHCDGGLRWQIFAWNRGFTYKNTISNSCFFQIATRLARYTRDQVYFDWAVRIYDWISRSGLVGPDHEVYDGFDIRDNCTDVANLLWTYNYGNMIVGCAYMYNATGGSDLWKRRLENFLLSVRVFYPHKYGGNLMVEVACEEVKTCNIDQPAFKAFLSRWLAITSQLAPFTNKMISKMIVSSAIGAARQCTTPDTSDGASTCGRTWFSPSQDEFIGVGEQMSALSAVQNVLLINHSAFAPRTLGTGAFSPIDRSVAALIPHVDGSGQNIGFGGSTARPTDLDDQLVRPDGWWQTYGRPVTITDRVGGWLLLSILIIGTTGMAFWMTY